MRIEYSTRIEIADPPAKPLTPAEEARLLAAMNRAIERHIEAAIFGGYHVPPGGTLRLVRASLGVINLDAAVT